MLAASIYDGYSNSSSHFASKGRTETNIDGRSSCVLEFPSHQKGFPLRFPYLSIFIPGFQLTKPTSGDVLVHYYNCRQFLIIKYQQSPEVEITIIVIATE